MTDRTDTAPDQDGGDATRLGGRPSKYNPEYSEQARRLCAKGFRDVDLAEFFGVAVSTIYVWRGEHPEFSEATKRGKRVADDMVERALFARATGYSHDAVKIMTRAVGDGVSVIEEVPFVEHHAPDTTAAIFWLKNRRPKEWRDRQEVQHEAGDTLTKFLAELDGKTRGIPGA